MGRRQPGALPLKTLPVICLLALVADVGSDPGQVEKKLSSLVRCGGIHVEHSSGEVLLSIFPDIPRVPASVLKLVTASFVLKTLGPDAHLETSFAYDESSRTLAVVGGGDPYLLSDELRTIVDSLKVRGITEVNRLTADCSAFRTPIIVDGQGNSSNPYDAGISALAVNFNTVAVEIKRGGIIAQGEPETPLTSSAVAVAKRFGRPGTHRLPMPGGERAGPLYALELLSAFLREKGVRAGGPTELFEYDGSMRVVYVHRNHRSVAEMVELMLEYSNNFAANMLLLAAARQSLSRSVDLEDAAVLLTEFARSEIGAAQTIALEGSGLSRKNRMSPRDVVRTLGYLFENGWRDLLPAYNGVLAKSGTLTGISCLGGYLPCRRGGDVRFALLLEGQHELRDDVLSVLKADLTTLVDQLP